MVSVSRTTAGGSPREIRSSTTGGPPVLVDVFSAPDARPGGRRAPTGGASAGRRRRAVRRPQVHRERDEHAGGDQQLQRELVERAQQRDAGERARQRPGDDRQRTSRHTGAGRRRSDSSVSRLTSTPEQRHQPDRLLGRGGRDRAAARRRSRTRSPIADCSAAPAITATAAATARSVIACHPTRAWPGTSRPSRSSSGSSTGCASFVRAEVWPLETVFDELGQDGFERAIAPLQEEVKARGLWAAHLPPELGGQGFGQVKLGLMHEILGTLAVRAVRVRQQRARLRQRRDPRAGRHARTRRSSGCTRCSPATCARRSR